MTIWLDRLIHPEHCSEMDIQKAIEHFWPCLFQQYHLCPQYKHIVMPATWAPDILAAETTSEHGSILIVEMKGLPPSTSLDATVDQVIDYGRWYHQEHPGENVRLAIIGPWKGARLERVMERDGYSVAVLPLRFIGQQLAVLADELLLWAAQSPARRAPIIDVEQWILKLPAITALVTV